MTDRDYRYPCKTKQVRDNFKAHVARGSGLPGIDFACDTGDDVFAISDGRVIQADKNAKQVRGINIIIKHPNGLESHYLHLSKILVRVGSRVKMGDHIAESGNTGTTSTGAHLHFALKRNGRCIDPMPLFKREAKERRVEKAAAAAVVVEVVTPTPEVIPE
jgi:murein DD-endopeptidase MepM/ murein hydrolase activator NlpD